MCGGGGGGGSASQDALAQEQNMQMQRTNARQQNEDWQRQQAIAQINQLYGVDSEISGTSVEEQTQMIPAAGFETESAGAPMTSSALLKAKGAAAKAQTSFNQTARRMAFDASAQRAARQSGYGRVRENALAVALDSLARQKAESERGVRFAVARSGLTGGSVDVDENQNLANRYSEGVLAANTGADQVVNNVRGRDEATRADLISRINAGMDANSASQSALAQMQNNQNVAKVDGQSNLLSNFFNAIGSGIGGYQYGAGQADNSRLQNTAMYNTTAGNGKIS